MADEITWPPRQSCWDPLEVGTGVACLTGHALGDKQALEEGIPTRRGSF